MKFWANFAKNGKPGNYKSVEWNSIVNSMS